LKQHFTKAFASILAVAAVGTPALALAQEAPAPADTPPAQAAPADDAETRQNAVRNMSLLMSALNSEQVEDGVKNVLMACIYSNSMRDITTAMDKAIAADPERFDRSDSGVMLGVMAGVCGYQPTADEADGAPAQPR